MKKIGLVLLTFVLFASFFFLFKSCVIQNPEPDECDIIEVTITKIYEGTSYDIVFHDSGTDSYYINRGLEQGLVIANLEEKVLNKKVTLHLPRLIWGTSEHIAQLATDEEVIFTEFK